MSQTAENQLRGKVLNVNKGRIYSEVTLELCNGEIISAVVPNDTVENMDLSNCHNDSESEFIVGISRLNEDGHCSC